MRPTFLGFETCKRGLATNQKVLDIVGQNLTNWDTPGYTRQRIDIVSVSLNSSASRYAVQRTDLAGQGVDMAGVSQIRDPYLDRRFRAEYGDASYQSQANTILGDLEAALREDGLNGTDGGGIQVALSDLFSACSKYAENPADEALANLVGVAAKNVTQTLRELSSKLDGVEEQTKYDMEISVKDYNDKLQKLAQLNKAIRDDVAATARNEYYGPNELLDQRNLLLDELSSYTDTDIKEEKDGTVTVKVNGHTVLAGEKADEINLRENNDGTVTMSWNSTGKEMNSTTGSLKAYGDFVNGAGPNMSSKGETLERGIRYYRGKLDTLARTFATAMNQVVPSQVDAQGNPVRNPDGSIAGYKVLFGARVPKEGAPGEYTTTIDFPIDASNIAISDDWVSDPTFVMFQKGNGDPTYAFDMRNLLSGEDASIDFISNGEKFTGSFQSYVNDYCNTLAADVNYYTSRAKATATIADEMLDRRDEVSAVNQDEETQSMMIYNKAYQAISRVLTTMDEALDVLINRTGMVGR